VDVPDRVPVAETLRPDPASEMAAAHQMPANSVEPNGLRQGCARGLSACAGYDTFTDTFERSHWRFLTDERASAATHPAVGTHERTTAAPA
jgi:hypothetical protein